MHQLTRQQGTTWSVYLADLALSRYTSLFGEHYDNARAPVMCDASHFISLTDEEDVALLLLDQAIAEYGVSPEEAVDCARHDFMSMLRIDGSFHLLTGEGYRLYYPGGSPFHEVVDHVIEKELFHVERSGDDILTHRCFPMWESHAVDVDELMTGTLDACRVHRLVYQPRYDDQGYYDATCHSVKRFEDFVMTQCQWEIDYYMATIGPDYEDEYGVENPYDYGRKFAYKGGGFTCTN